MELKCSPMEAKWSPMELKRSSNGAQMEHNGASMELKWSRGVVEGSKMVIKYIRTTSTNIKMASTKHEKNHQNNGVFVEGRFWSKNIHIPEEFTLPCMKKTSKMRKRSAQKPSKKLQINKNNLKKKQCNSQDAVFQKKHVFPRIFNRNESATM